MAQAKTAGRKGHRWRKVRQEVLDESDICYLCGKPGADTVDHVIPLSRGGDPLDKANLRPAHRSCNSSKGADVAPAPLRTSRDW